MKPTSRSNGRGITNYEPIPGFYKLGYSLFISTAIVICYKMQLCVNEHTPENTPGNHDVKRKRWSHVGSGFSKHLQVQETDI